MHIIILLILSLFSLLSSIGIALGRIGRFSYTRKDLEFWAKYENYWINSPICRLEKAYDYDQNRSFLYYPPRHNYSKHEEKNRAELVTYGRDVNTGEWGLVDCVGNLHVSTRQIDAWYSYGNRYTSFKVRRREAWNDCICKNCGYVNTTYSRLEDDSSLASCRFCHRPNFYYNCR